MILASDDEHNVFPDVPMILFKINKSLKAHLVKSQLPDLDEVGSSMRVEEKEFLVIYVKI